MNKELAADTNLSHYRVVSKLGTGGMGEVSTCTLMDFRIVGGARYRCGRFDPAQTLVFRPA